MYGANEYNVQDVCIFKIKSPTVMCLATTKKKKKEKKKEKKRKPGSKLHTHTHTHTRIKPWFRYAYHVPEEVGDPVDSRVDAADKLQVFAVGHSLLDQEEHEAGRHEGHGKDHADRHNHVHSTVVTVEINTCKNTLDL